MALRFAFLFFLLLPSFSEAQFTGLESFWRKPNRWTKATLTGTPPLYNGAAFVAASPTHLFVWGGYNEIAGTHFAGGSILEFATGEWRTINPTGAPAARSWGCTAWDGTYFIVYGGWNGTAVMGNGFRYNPATDTWIGMAAGPVTFSPGCGVTSTDMVYWGGQVIGATEYNTGQKYNFATNTWTAMAASPLSTRRNASAVAISSSRIFFWGGRRSATSGVAGDGAIYDLNANTWTSVATTGAPTARSMSAIAWNGSQVVMWGGEDNGGGIASGGAFYTPATNTWTTMSATNAPDGPATNGVMAWDHRFFFYGGWTGSANFAGGRFYNATTNTWTLAKMARTPSPRSRPVMIRRGEKLFLFGGWGYDTGWFFPTDGYWYTP